MFPHVRASKVALVGIQRSSSFCCMCLGRRSIRFSRFDMCGKPPYMSACVIHVWIGWVVDVITIRVIVRNILLVRRHRGESRSVSRSMTKNGEFFSFSNFDNGMSENLPLVRISHQFLLSFTQISATIDICRGCLGSRSVQTGVRR